MPLKKAIGKFLEAPSTVGTPSTRLYMKKSTDTTKMSLIHKVGSRFYTQEVSDLKLREAQSVTISELPGSAAKVSNF